MGNTTGVKKEIEKISESKPNILDAKGIIIATFTSFVDVNEISTWFTLNNRNFVVFELNKETSGFFLSKPEIHNALFGFLTNSEEDLTEKTNEFMDSINKSVTDIQFTSVTTTMAVNELINKVQYNFSEEEIDKMTKVEKDELYNKLIDNGVDKLTENDKKLLVLLCK